MTMELKPQNFHLDGKEWKYNAYIKEVGSAINVSTSIGNDLKEYLIALLNYTAGTISKEKMEEEAWVWTSSLEVIKMQKYIKKFYGEVLGPIWTTKNNVFTVSGKKELFLTTPL